MTVHLNRALEGLKSSLLALATLVEEQLAAAVVAFNDSDADLAAEVVRRDIEVDQLEVDLEEECLKILALHQPVAFDLRFTVSVLKITNDLERIGDLAVNFAERVQAFPVRQSDRIPFDVGAMAKEARIMLKRAIDSFIELDSNSAWAVREDDLLLDKMHEGHYKDICDGILKYPEDASEQISFLSISRYLERIGDLATNIAEDVVYLVEGQIVRHSKDNEHKT